MNDYTKLAVCSVLTAIMVLTVRKHSDAIASALAIAGCCICGCFICELAAPVVSFFDETAQTAQIGSDLLSPLFKTVGIGFLTQISSDICTDSGQSALAKLVQTGGSVMCICASLPLFAAVLSMVQTMNGG